MTGQDLSTAEVAALFQVSEQAVLQWASAGKLPAAWVEGRRRYPAAAVAELAGDRNLPLPDWLRAASASAQRAAP